MDSKAKRKLVNLEYKLPDNTPPDSDPAKGMQSFLNDAAPIVERQFPKYTGSVTLHIRDGKLASWENKAGGRYKE